jgi:Hint domain
MIPRAIDLFCGLGGWTEGLLAAGYDVTGYDIEAHAYGSERYPAKLVLQDVLTLDGAQFADAALIVASPPCFVADTLILTARGMLPIPEVVAGDLVLTHRNRWRRVIRTGSTMAPTLVARGFGGFLEGTAEHPIYTRKNVGSFSVWDKNLKAPINVLKKMSEPEWTPLAETEGRHWASPTIFESLPVPSLPNGLPDEPAFWWIVGRWVGDGWVRLRREINSGDEVAICCGNAEADDLEIRLSDYAARRGKRAQPGEIHWRRSQERTTTRFTCASNFFARHTTCEIEGRTVQQRDTWSVTWTPDTANNRLVKSEDGFQWGKVRTVDPAQEAAHVWNLEVEEDNSYTADGVVVHNCQEFSYMAMPWTRAKQIGRALRGADEFPQGYRGSRTIAELTALFDACFRIQREASAAAGRKIPMLVENVRGAEPWVGRAAWNFGSYYLWGDVPALMPPLQARKFNPDGTRHGPGSWFAVADSKERGAKSPGFRFDGSGRSFQSESGNRHVVGAAEGRKHRGDWFRDPDCPSRQGGQSAPAEGRKGAGAGAGAGWFDRNLCALPSKSPARKAASARIAKIPFALSEWIARTYKPALEIAP